MRYTKELLPSATPTSTIGLGAAAFGYMYSRQSGRQEAVNIIKEALAAGINFFDTAPWYGYNDGAAEKPFAEGLRGVDRNSYIMATKCAQYGDNLENRFPWDFRAERVEAEFMRSLEHLQLEYVDLLQVHSSEILHCFPNDRIDIMFSETLPALDRLRQRGLIRYIGITAYPIDSLKLQVEKSPVKIDTVMSWAKMTLADEELKDYLAWFKQRGVGVMTASPMGRGSFLSDENSVPKDNHFHPTFLTACKEARNICKDENVKFEKLALGYCIEESEKSGVDLVLTGPSSIGELRSNLDVYENGLSKHERDVCKRIREGPFGPNLKHRDVYSPKLDYAYFMSKLKQPAEGLVM